jgi:PKD repeat protein
MNVVFSNTSFGGLAFQWSFGNGSFSPQSNPNTIYNASTTQDTTYTVKLVAYNSPGCADSIIKTVRLFPTPAANFTIGTDAGCGPLSTTFTNTSNHKYGGTINDLLFNWNFDNGKTSVAKDTSSRFIASQVRDSLYDVKLVVQSRFGCRDSITKQMRIYPNASARFNQSTPDGCGPLNVQFANSSTPNDTGSIAIMSFNWRFGNGATSTQVSPTNTFLSNATKDTLYDIRLIAYSEHNCPDTTYKQIRVYPKPISPAATLPVVLH